MTEPRPVDPRLDFPLSVAMTTAGAEQVMRVGSEHAAKCAVEQGAHPPVGILFGRYSFPDGNRIPADAPYEVVPIFQDTTVTFDLKQQGRFFSTMHKVAERIDAYAATFCCEMVVVEGTPLPEAETPRERHRRVVGAVKDMEAWVQQHGRLSEHSNPATKGSILLLTMEHVALPQQRIGLAAEITRAPNRRIISVGAWHPYKAFDVVQADPLLPASAWVPEDKRASLSRVPGNA